MESKWKYFFIFFPKNYNAINNLIVYALNLFYCRFIAHVHVLCAQCSRFIVVSFMRWKTVPFMCTFTAIALRSCVCMCVLNAQTFSILGPYERLSILAMNCAGNYFSTPKIRYLHKFVNCNVIERVANDETDKQKINPKKKI